MEGEIQPLMGLLVREAGKTFANAIAEVREAVDFLRYYAQARNDFTNDAHRPLGPVVCISPWNFPLAIFTGQVPPRWPPATRYWPAEQTPLVAARPCACCSKPAFRRRAATAAGPGETVGAAWSVTIASRA
jgi:RHH-type proline utilization regulon transcriptional repressor/proline dehydrogenase/delta 1-pyrroline-5-carboxylate dehydrogenase